MTFTTLRAHGCVCGASFEMMETTPVRIELTEVLRKAPISVLSWLGALDRYGLRGKPAKKQSRREVSEFADLVERGAVIVANWALAFPELLGRLRPAAEPGHRELALVNAALPGLKARVAAIPDIAWRERIGKAIDSFIEESQQSDYPLTGRNGPTMLTLKEAATHLGIGVTRLASMLRADPLRAVRATHAGRSRFAITGDVVDAYRAALSNSLSLSAVGRYLTLSTERVMALCEAGLLVGKRQSFACTDVAMLRDRLMQVAVRLDCSSSALISWPVAMRLNVPFSMTVPFLRAVLAREIQLGLPSSGNRLTDATFRRDDVVQWVANAARTAGINHLTLADAAIALGVKCEVISSLIRTGHLHSEIRHIGRRPARYVTLKEVARFRSNYVPLVDLARKAGIAPKHAAAWAVSNGIELATGPSLDGCRQYFARR